MPSRPLATEYHPYYEGYISLVPEAEVLPVLEAQIADLERLAKSVSLERETYRYAEGKWSVREVIGHLIDGERIFGYRAFCVSRDQKTPLPGYEQDDYVAVAHYSDRPLADLVEEMILLRKGNLAFLRRLAEPDWEKVGTANQNPVSARALAYIMAGHLRHHLGVLHTSYGLPQAV